MFNDDLHCLLVCDWLFAALGRPGFGYSIPAPANGALLVHAPPRIAAPVNEMSEMLLGLGHERCSDWHAMRGRLLDGLSPAARDVVLRAEAADPQFDRFFEGFARSARPRPVDARRSPTAGLTR